MLCSQGKPSFQTAATSHHMTERSPDSRPSRNLRDSAWGVCDSPHEALLPSAPSPHLLHLSHGDASVQPSADSCTVQITISTSPDQNMRQAPAVDSRYMPSDRYPVIQHVAAPHAAPGYQNPPGLHTDYQSSGILSGLVMEQMSRQDCFDTAREISPVGEGHRPTQSAFAHPDMTQSNSQQQLRGHVRCESAPQNQSLSHLRCARQLSSPFGGAHATAMPPCDEGSQDAAVLHQQPPTQHKQQQLLSGNASEQEQQSWIDSQYSNWQQGQTQRQYCQQQQTQQRCYQQPTQQRYHLQQQTQQQQQQQVRGSPVKAARDSRSIQPKAGRSLSTALDAQACRLPVFADVHAPSMQTADIEMAPLCNGLIRSVLLVDTSIPLNTCNTFDCPACSVPSWCHVACMICWLVVPQIGSPICDRQASWHLPACQLLAYV